MGNLLGGAGGLVGNLFGGIGGAIFFFPTTFAAAVVVEDVVKVLVVVGFDEIEDEVVFGVDVTKGWMDRLGGSGG